MPTVVVDEARDWKPADIGFEKPADIGGQPISQPSLDLPRPAPTKLKLSCVNIQLKLAAYVRGWFEHAL